MPGIKEAVRIPPTAIAKELLNSDTMERENLPVSHILSCPDLPRP
jgi:hypothetical protein